MHDLIRIVNSLHVYSIFVDVLIRGKEPSNSGLPKEKRTFIKHHTHNKGKVLWMWAQP